MSLRYVKHFDLNILKFADNLILHGNLFQRMAELYANDFFHNICVWTNNCQVVTRSIQLRWVYIKLVRYVNVPSL